MSYIQHVGLSNTLFRSKLSSDGKATGRKSSLNFALFDHPFKYN